MDSAQRPRGRRIVPVSKPGAGGSAGAGSAAAEIPVTGCPAARGMTGKTGSAGRRGLLPPRRAETVLYAAILKSGRWLIPRSKRTGRGFGPRACKADAHPTAQPTRPIGVGCAAPLGAGAGGGGIFLCLSLALIAPAAGGRYLLARCIRGGAEALLRAALLTLLTGKPGRPFYARGRKPTFQNALRHNRERLQPPAGGCRRFSF